MVAAVLAVFAPTGAPAELVCRFNVECFGDEICRAGDFEVSILDGDPIVLSTVFGDLPLIAFTGRGVWLAEGEGMSLLLSRDEGGTARASAHMDGAMVNYLGICKEEG